MRPTISKKWNNLWIALLVIGLFSGLIGKLLDPVFAFLKALLPPQ
jgi:hypothetical protein